MMKFLSMSMFVALSMLSANDAVSKKLSLKEQLHQDYNCQVMVVNLEEERKALNDAYDNGEITDEIYMQEIDAIDEYLDSMAIECKRQ